MIVVAIIGLLAAIAIPNFIHHRAVAQATACINNLRQIDAAVQQFAMESGKSSGSYHHLSQRSHALHQIKHQQQHIPAARAVAFTALTQVGNIPSGNMLPRQHG